MRRGDQRQTHVGPEGSSPPARVTNRSAGRACDQPPHATVRADAVLPDERARAHRLHRRPTRRCGNNAERSRQAFIAEATRLMRGQKRRDSLFGSHHDARPEGANQVRSGTRCWKMWRWIPSGLSASNLAFQIEPIAIHIQATRRGARSPHRPSQSRIFLPQQVRIDQPSRHGLIAKPRPAFKERGDPLRSTSPRDNLHLLIQPTHNSLDALP